MSVSGSINVKSEGDIICEGFVFLSIFAIIIPMDL